MADETAENNINQHIYGALEYYLKAENTHHAVMLTGEWGCGKTYFIKEFIEQIERLTPYEQYKKELHNIPAKYACYISLYGVDTLEDLRKELFIVLRPLMTKFTSYAPIIDTISASAANLAKVSVSLSLSPKALIKTEYKLSKRLRSFILIFDDLERCAIPTQDLFGFINQLVEHNGQKVILIANEKKLKEKTEASEANTAEKIPYDEIKEKLVGTTLELQTSPQTVLDYFISEMTEGDAKICAEENKRTILNLLAKMNIYNYRSLRAALYDFGRLLGKIGNIFPDFMTDEDNAKEARRQLLSLVLVMELLHRKGISTEDKLVEKVKSYLENDLECGLIFPSNLLFGFLLTGKLSSDIVEAYLSQHFLFRANTDLAWPQFQYALFWCLNKEKFNKLKEATQKELEEQKITKIGDILSLASTIDQWEEQDSSNKLDFISPDITSYFKVYLRQLNSDGKLDIDPKAPVNLLNSTYGDYARGLQAKEILKTYTNIVLQQKQTQANIFLKNILKWPDASHLYEYQQEHRMDFLIVDWDTAEVADAIFSYEGSKIADMPLYDFLVGRYIDAQESARLATEKEWFAKLRNELESRAEKEQAPFKSTAKHIIDYLFKGRQY